MTLGAGVTLALALSSAPVAANEPAGAGTTLRDVAGARLVDARFGDGADGNVAVLWMEPDGADTIPYAATSVDGGTTFTSPYPIVGGAGIRTPAIAICRDVTVTAHAVDQPDPAPPGRRTIVFAVRPQASGGGFQNYGVADGRTRDPALACLDRDILLGWVRVVGGTPRLRVRWWGDAAAWLPTSAAGPAPRRADGHVAALPAIGPAGVLDWDLGRIGGPGRQAPSMSGTTTRGYAAWLAGGRLKLARWRVPAGGGAPALVGTAILAQGSDARPLARPLVAAAGRRVVVAWTRCGSLLARVSTDRGASFGPARVLRAAPCPGETGALLHSVDVAGRRIAVAFRHIRDGRDHERIVRSSSDLARWSTTTVSPVGDRWAAGIATRGGTTGLAAVRDIGSVIGYLPPGSAVP